MTDADQQITYDEFRTRIRSSVRIADFLADRGHPIRVTERGSGSTRCPFHDDHRPSFSVYVDPRDSVERFRCHGCGVRGDIFDLARLWDDHPDHYTTLRSLAERYGVPWPAQLAPRDQHRGIMDRAARFYERGLTPEVVAALAARGFPEAFVRERRIGYAPIGTEATKRRLTSAVTKAGVLSDALAAGLVLRTRGGDLRDLFWSDRCGYIIFPNLSGGTALGLQGRAHPSAPTRAKYLNPVGSRHQLYNAEGARSPHVLLCEGIPDTLSALLASPPGTGACGIFGTEGWRTEFLAFFRAARRVSVIMDRDATEQAIDIAMAFGTRGRVIVPPDELGPTGDLNDWLVGPAGRDSDRLRTMLSESMRASPTPWALVIDRMPSPREPWDFELMALREQTHGCTPYTGLDLLRDLGRFDPLFRDSHLLRLSERIGIPFATLRESAIELARATGAA